MDPTRLQELTASLLAREKELIDALRNAAPKPETKDTWDKLSTLLPFFSGILIAGVGFYFTSSYNRQSDRLAQLQTLERFIPQLTGSDDNKRIARQIISQLGTPEMNAVLTSIIAEGSESEKRIAQATLVANAAVIFDNSNTGGVAAGATPPTFTIARRHLITNIWSYHWNDGRGARPGSIGLEAGDGKQYGPWQVTASSGQNGALNVNWECSPNIVIPPGTYRVIDSDPYTWSQNGASNQAGFTRVKGTPLEGN
jgi:hypothetical protein